MTAFEALFAFYGLLLGLAIAAVVTGFGEQWRQRRVRPIGFLTPLLGIYVLLSATQQWQSFWGARDFLTMTPVNLLMCLGMALPYIFVAQVMFPTAGTDSADSDDHYLVERRVLLSVLMLPLIISSVYNFLLNESSLRDLQYVSVARGIPLFVLSALIPLRQRVFHYAGWSLLILLRLWMIAF